MTSASKRQFKQLSAQERACIEYQLDQGCKVRAIARTLQRAPSTISRELSRNRTSKSPHQAAQPAAQPAVRSAQPPYCCLRAAERARCLAHKPRQARRLVPGNPLWQRVVTCLRQSLSPGQASDILARVEHVRISHESIYQALYAMPKGELRREVLALLPWGRKGRKARGAGADRRRGLIADMTSIEERPIEVDERLVPGHWEGDLIKGAGNRSQIGTLVERTTLFTLLVQVPKATAVDTANAFIGVLNRVDAQCRLSMTYDQGKEMSHHAHLARQTGMKVYFAHPHSPWERGINENTNGLLRRYFPKGQDLSGYSQQQLDEVAMQMNAKPRKSLGGKSPAELFLPKGTFDFNAYWSNILSASNPNVAFGT